MKEVFQNIFNNGGWRAQGTVSGLGSTFEATKVLRDNMLTWPEKYGSKIVDIPCGDMNWMHLVAHKFDKYWGIDIVPELIDLNMKRFNYLFGEGDIASFDYDQLGDIDIIFTRDCLVHLDKASIIKALKCICNSKAKYLAMTTFADGFKRDFRDIEIGQWRPICFTVDPFNFPTPIETINEDCKENEGAYSDKSIGVWAIEDIREAVCAL